MGMGGADGKDGSGDEDETAAMEIVSGGGQWYEILELLVQVRSTQRLQIRNHINAAIEATSNPNVKQKLKEVLGPQYSPGRAKCRALMLVEEFTGERVWLMFLRDCGGAGGGVWHRALIYCLSSHRRQGAGNPGPKELFHQLAEGHGGKRPGKFEDEAERQGQEGRESTDRAAAEGFDV